MEELEPDITSALILFIDSRKINLAIRGALEISPLAPDFLNIFKLQM